MTTTGSTTPEAPAALPAAARPAVRVDPGGFPAAVLRIPRDPHMPAPVAPAHPLWDAASGRFDPTQLRRAIVARRWTVPEFVVAPR